MPSLRRHLNRLNIATPGLRRVFVVDDRGSSVRMAAAAILAGT
jgi:hypothetical protein